MEQWGSEKSLVEALQGGDEQAFAELLDRYHAPMVRLARSIVKDPHLADEVVQDSWESVYKALERFEGRSSLKTWLYRIVRNRALSVTRREQRYEAVDEESDPTLQGRFDGRGHWEHAPVAWPFKSADSLVDDRETREALRLALEKLPTRQHEVFVLSEMEELEPEEVCNVVGISESNRRVLLHRARTKLRTALEVFYRGGN